MREGVARGRAALGLPSGRRHGSVPPQRWVVKPPHAGTDGRCRETKAELNVAFFAQSPLPRGYPGAAKVEMDGGARQSEKRPCSDTLCADP
jgi:hypothetical protein